MLPRDAYDALERKHTLYFNQGQPDDEVTDDKDVDIMDKGYCNWNPGHYSMSREHST